MKKILLVFIIGMFLISFTSALTLQQINSVPTTIKTIDGKTLAIYSNTTTITGGYNIYISKWNISYTYQTTQPINNTLMLVRDKLISFDASKLLNISNYNSRLITNADLQSGNQSLNVHIIETDEIYTKSRVPNATGKYFNLFNESIYSKLTHFAYQLINGQPRLNQESRDVGQEGYIACDRKCTAQYQGQDKFKDWTICKANC